jgi:hypothetical protein
MKGKKMKFLRAWFLGYVSPRRLAEQLQDRPAPLWGFMAQLIRATLVSLALYLPIALMGREPPTPSYLPFIESGRYYLALVWIAPLVIIVQWLLGGAVIHTILRIAGRKSDIDRILNITGMAALVVGALLVLWDWLWIASGGLDQIWLGLSHLVIDLWGVVIIVAGLRKILRVPTWLAVLVTIAYIAAAMPLAIMFMRSPL